MPPRLRALLLLLVAGLAGGPAFAADGVKPRPRPLPVVKPAEDLKLRPQISLVPRAAPNLPPPMSVGAAFSAGGLAANGLASAGLRSTLPVVADPAAQCRTTCTHARIVCDSRDAIPECAPRWAMCVANCNH